MPKDIICNAHYCAFYGQPVHRIDRYIAGSVSPEGRPSEQPPDDTWPPTDEQIESWRNKGFIVKGKQ